MTDQQCAADDLLRIGCVVPVESARMSAVLIDGDGIGLVLEDQTRAIGRSAADKGGDAAAPIGLRQRRAPVHVVPCGTVLQPQIERAVAEGKPLEIRCGICERNVDMALRILRDDVAVQSNRAAARRAVPHVDAQASRIANMECGRICSCRVHLGTETVQCHGIIHIGVDAMADFRTADIHLGHAGNREHPLVALDAVCFFQRTGGVFIVHKQAERTGFDIDSLFRRKANTCRFRDSFGLAAGLDRQHMPRSVDLQILFGKDRAAP